MNSFRTGRRRIALAIGLVLALGIPGVLRLATADESYDVAILNGHVMDPESGLDAVRHIGIRAGKIVAISNSPLRAATTIDASKLVVAPGFIDLHRSEERRVGKECRSR